MGNRLTTTTVAQDEVGGSLTTRYALAGELG